MTRMTSRRKRPARRRRLSRPPPLRLTAYAMAKLLFLRDLGPTEVGGFGVSAPGDLLLVEDVQLVRQQCSPVSVKFDDASVADFFDAQVDQGRVPEQFGRIWIHTHPAISACPSATDEETFARCFGRSNWALMFILARGGQTYARLRINTGPGGEMVLPVEVDFAAPFPAADQAAWQLEYQQAVSTEPTRPIVTDGAGRELPGGDWSDLGWPDDPWPDPFFNREFLEPLDEQLVKPF